MCKFTVSCPLCSHPSFNSVGSLRTNLIKAIDSPIKCPVCDEIVNGLDKLTLHLISHNGIISLTKNNDNTNGNNSNNNNTKNRNNNSNNQNNMRNVEMSSDRVLMMNTNENPVQQQLQQLQQQQQQQEIINAMQNDNQTGHTYLLNGEPFKLIAPILLTPELLHSAAMSALTASSPTIISSMSNDLSSALLPSDCVSFGQTNTTYQLQQQQQPEQLQLHLQQQQLNMLSAGATLMQIKNADYNSNLSNNYVIVKNNMISDGAAVSMKAEECSNSNNNASNRSFNMLTVEPTTVPPKEEHRCNLCDVTFSSFDIFKKHIQVMHQVPFDVHETATVTKPTSPTTNGSAQGPFQCNLCAKSYKIKARLRLHIKVKHGLSTGSTTATTTTASPSPDSGEGAEPSTTKLRLSEKLRRVKAAATDNANKDAADLDATKSDANNQDSLDSTNSKSDAIPKPWKCDICSKYYTTKYFLKKHKRIHTGETPYKCNICNKSFTFQQSYHKHLLYHSDDKPHICKICNRAFKELCTLHNHERIHSGEKPFECEICGKRFRQRVSNYVHQRTHTGAKPYSCEICLRKFRYKVTLRTHKCTASDSLDENAEEGRSEDVPASVNKPQSPSESAANVEQNSESQTGNMGCSSDVQMMTAAEDNLEKLLQNVEILADTPFENLLRSEHQSESSDSLGESNVANDSDLNEQRANKSIDDLVAESCNKLGIGSCSSINAINQSYGSPTMANGTPSPSEQLQHLCLYSPAAMEDNLNVDFNLNDDSFKQFLFDMENSKHS